MRRWQAYRTRAALCHVAVRATASDFRVPYGESDFADVREGGFWWRDNTAFLRPVLDGPKHQMLLRPPGFGKSLFASMLHWYVDENLGACFNAIADTEIDLTEDDESLDKHRRSYAVMKIDLGVGVGDGSDAGIHAAVDQAVRSSVKAFCTKYKRPVPNLDPGMAIGAMGEVLAETKQLTMWSKCFVIVDDYDWLANKLLLERPREHAKLTPWEEDVKITAPLRALFEAIKASNARSFTTGTTPIALSTDGRGWNACEDLTHDPNFGAVCGLREADVRAALRQLIPADAAAQERVLRLMQHLYGGYRFPAVGGSGVTEPLFHPQMCVFFFRQWLKPANAQFRDAVLNRWSRAPEHADLNELIDYTAAAGGDTVMRAIAKHPSLPLLQTGLASTRGHVYASVSERLRLRELLRHETDPPEPVHPLATTTASSRTPSPATPPPATLAAATTAARRESPSLCRTAPSRTRWTACFRLNRSSIGWCAPSWVTFTLRM